LRTLDARGNAPLLDKTDWSVDTLRAGVILDILLFAVIGVRESAVLDTLGVVTLTAACAHVLLNMLACSVPGM
jgi:hypothetical protein